MDNLAEIALELDERRRAAQSAFREADLATYASLFSPSLAYREADGRTIGREALMRDVAAQIRIRSRATSLYVRESITGSEHQATETVTQTAVVDEPDAFGLLRRRWSLHRRAAYRWAKSGGDWIVESVDVFSEEVSHLNWSLARTEAVAA